MTQQYMHWILKNILMKPNVKWRYSVWIRLLYIIIFVIVLGELFLTITLF